MLCTVLLYFKSITVPEKYPINVQPAIPHRLSMSSGHHENLYLHKKQIYWLQDLYPNMNTTELSLSCM